MNDMLREGSPRLDDILDLKAAAKLAIPTRESQVNRTTKAFAVVLAVALGLRHPCYRAYKKEIVDAYEQIQPKLETLADTYPSEPVYAQFLRWLQLRFHEYWLDLDHTLGNVEPPRFAILYDAIRYKQWIRPQIPPTYLATPKKRTAKSTTSTATRSGTTTTTKKDEAVYAANPNRIQKLIERGATVGKITTFLKAAGTDDTPAQIPKTEAGEEMCLSWHLKGGCYSNCQRLQKNPAAHGNLTPSEVESLCQFIDTGLDKIANS